MHYDRLLSIFIAFFGKNGTKMHEKRPKTDISVDKLIRN